MMRRAEKLTASAAHELGIVDTLTDDYVGMIEAAVARVHALTGRVRPPDGAAVNLAAFEPIAPTAANGQRLSIEVMRILENAVRDAAAATTLTDALEIGYCAFGASACAAAAREGINAFQEHRNPDFAKTG